jgi:hypothetical protein
MSDSGRTIGDGDERRKMRAETEAMLAAPAASRQQLEDAFLASLRALCAQEGPWLVLWLATEELRPAFRAMGGKKP